MRLWALIPLTVLLGSVPVLVVPPTAGAGPDEPSNALVTREYYLPFALDSAGTGDRLDTVKVPALERELERALAAAKDRRRPFKVAIVASEVDLGAVPEMLAGPPQRYAAFLYDEIAPVLAKTEASVVVATPRGVGVAGPQATAAARSAAARVSLARNPSPAQLAAAAVDGVHAVAAANGHPLGDGGDEDGGEPWLLLGGLAFLLAVGAAVALRLRISQSGV